MNQRAILSIVSIAGLACLASAASAAYEPFDYAAGTPIDGSANGGIGWNSPWGRPGSNAGGTIETTAPGSNYPGLMVTGNKATITPTSASTVSVREFAPTGSGVSTGSLYASMLIDKTNAGTRFLTSNLRGGSAGGDTAQRMSFGSISGRTEWGFGVTGSTIVPLSGVSNDSATPTLLVVRIDFDVIGGPGGAGERIRLFVNPTPGNPEPAANADSMDPSNFGTTVFDLGNLSAIDIGAGFFNANNGQTTSTGTFDEYRVGTSFAEVVAVPEPATLGLLAAAGLGALSRRRRWA